MKAIVKIELPFYLPLMQFFAEDYTFHEVFLDLFEKILVLDLFKIDLERDPYFEKLLLLL